MNHDYTHCLDFTEKCPKKCFRAQLERDLRNNAKDYAGMCFSYAHFYARLKGSRECCMIGDSGIKVFADSKNYVIDVDVDEDLWKNKSKDELLKLIEQEIARALKGR